jgi:hypothetical protein
MHDITPGGSRRRAQAAMASSRTWIFSLQGDSIMTKKAILLIALVGVLHAGATAFALSGALGNADRIILREGYSQYEGRIDLREASGTVTFYSWGGDRCAAALVAPTDRQIDILLSAHVHGHGVSLDYTSYNSTYGSSRCWDGGIQVY